MSEAGLLVVAGMARAGTTYLYHRFADHPAFAVAARKETNYFSARFERGRSWFDGLYAEDGWRVDVTPTYFTCPSAIERIAAWPAPRKVVLGVRDPADQAVSLYEHFVDLGIAVPSFGAFLEGFDQESHGGRFHLSYVDGAIARSIDAWCAAFGDDLLLFDFAALGADPVGVLQAIENFVGVAPWFDATNVDRTPINARGRRRWSPVRGLHAGGLADAVAACFPAPLLRGLRTRLDRLEARTSSPRPSDPNHVALAESRLRAERVAYRELFARGPILRGGSLVRAEVAT